MDKLEKANERVLRTQAARKAKTIAGTVLAAAASAEPSKPEQKICGKCGGSSRFSLCGDCGKKVHDDQERAYVRKKAIIATIPKLYQPARMCFLSKGLRATVKTLPAGKGLLLWGLPGRGKTYAMAAIARSLIWAGKTVIRTSYEMLCMEIRDTFKQQASETEFSIIKRYLLPDVLFIEDVGATKSVGVQESDFSRRTFLVLLDQRLEQCKATFVTTNKSVEDLSRSFDDRIASRLQQACEVIELTGKDRRKD